MAVPVAIVDEVLVESGSHHHRAAAVARGRVVDVMTVSRSEQAGIGSIYLGRLTRMAPGLKAAFVEIGFERPAFLNVGTNAPRAGKTAVVQIVDAALVDKGPRVSTRLAIEGRFAVLLPRDKGVSISRRIDKAARVQLNAAVRPLVRPGEGVIVRAAALQARPDELATDILAMRAIWTAAAAKLEASPPACVYREPPLRRILCAFPTPATRFVFADAAAAHEARTVALGLGGDLAARIEAAREPGHLFDRYAVGDDLAAAEGTSVALAGGGRLAVERTAALLAIDVDSGGGSAGSEAAVATNLEAATEIARQLRLREVRGTVMIDFIRMSRRADYDRVRLAMAEASAADRVPVRALGWTRGGLLELVRAPADEEKG